MNNTMTRAIITVVGKDNVGIIATVCTYLAKHQINILNITQTIVDGYFNMIMIVDLTQTTATFDAISTGLEEIGKNIGVQVKIQLAEIFKKMHRI